MIKNILKLFILIILITATQTGFTQVSLPYSVGTWPGFRNCAISYTFDDGCSNQFTMAIPMFDEAGYKLTLFTVTGWGPNWTNLQSAANKGHEVANHTATHVNLSTSTIETQKSEIETSNNLINSKVTSQKCVTMATPYCAEGKDSLAAKYFIAVRGCQGNIESKTPANFMNVSSIVCGNLGTVYKVKDFKTKADQASSSKGWLVYLIHGIDNDGGYSPLGSDTLKASLQYLKENDSKFWVNTFGNVARYIRERNCVSVSETSASETSFSVTITDTLDNETFNYPLTFRRTLPDGWSQVTITQNGSAITDTIIEVNSIKYIQFEAIPDGGSVVISKDSSSGKYDLKKSLNKKLKTWTDSQSLYFTVPSTYHTNLEVTFYNLGGSKKGTFTNFAIIGSTGQIPLNSLPTSGVYLVKLSDQKNVWTTKLRLL